MSPSGVDSSARLEQIGGRLSEQARQILDEIERPLADGASLDEIAAQLRIDRREIDRLRRQLHEEATAITDGAELPGLTAELTDGLAASLAGDGQIVPVILDEDGGVIDGRHRLHLLEQLGKEPVTVTIDTGGDRERRRRLALTANTMRRSLSNAERRRLVEAEILHDPARADRAIASVLGVSNHLVAHARASLEERGRLQPFKRRVGRDGVVRGQSRPKGSHPAKRVATPPKGFQVELLVDPDDELAGVAFAAPGARLHLTETRWAELGYPSRLRAVVSVCDD